MANEDRIRQVVAAIEASPQQFDMRLFINECGTTFCFAGWALKLAGEDMDYWRSEYWKNSQETRTPPDSVTRMERKAAEWLGLTTEQAVSLFYFAGVGDDVEALKDYIEQETGISFDAVAS